MAGDWIKMRSNLWDDPRVGRLVDLTNSSEAAVIGALYWLWSTADQHTEDGAMPGLSLRQIDRKTGIPGFGAALCEIGWLSDDPQGVVVQKFEEHNGTSAKRRCTDAQRKANSRSVSASDADKGRTDDGHDAPTLGAREREEKSRNTSVPDGTGGEPPAGGLDGMKVAGPMLLTDPDEIIFGYGVPYLMGADVKERNARSFLSMARKLHGDIKVIDALRDCMKAKPVDPLAWLGKAIGPKAAGAKRSIHDLSGMDHGRAATDGDIPDA